MLDCKNLILNLPESNGRRKTQQLENKKYFIHFDNKEVKLKYKMIMTMITTIKIRYQKIALSKWATETKLTSPNTKVKVNNN